MTVRKTSVSLPEDVTAILRQEAGPNTSAYVAEAIREKAARDRNWQRYLELYGAPDASAVAYWEQRFGAAAPAS